MSTEIEFRKHLRERKKKQKIKRNIFVFIISIIIITVFLLCVKGFLTKIRNRAAQDPDFIFNGYVYPMPPEKNTDILEDLPNGDGIKTAYITFDDGPNKSITPIVLDVLRKYNVKATFFLVGTLIEQNPDVARRLYDEGHLLANHSYSHEYSALYADTQSFMNQLNQTDELIVGITGKENYPKIFRFPGGGYNAGSHGEMKQQCKLSLGESGYRFCDWNALIGDAEIKSPTTEALLKRLKSSSEEKEDIVILMHDAVSKAVTAQALPQLLEYLMAQGYTFDTLDHI